MVGFHLNNYIILLFEGVDEKRAFKVLGCLLDFARDRQIWLLDWSVGRGLAYIIWEQKFQKFHLAAGLAKERTEKFGGLEDRFENLQSRCAEIKEFYNADGFDFYYQTPEKESPPKIVITTEVNIIIEMEMVYKNISTLL
jgi:hypothetical protein